MASVTEEIASRGLRAGETPRAPTSRLHRILRRWLPALALVAVLLGVFYFTLLRPYLEVRAALRPASEWPGLFEANPHIAAEEIHRLGGERVAARKLASYCRLPDAFAQDRGIAQTLMTSCGSEAVPLLISLLQSSTWQTRYGAVDALGRSRDRRTVEPLATALSTDPEPEVRARAAWALGAVGDTRAVEPLIAALKDPLETAAASDPDELVRSEAKEALAKIRSAKQPEPAPR